MSSETVTSAAAMAVSVAARSPDSQCQMWLLAFSGPRSGRSTNAPGSSDLCGSTMTSSGSYSTITAATPSAAEYRSVATTAATSWDWYITVVVGSTICLSPARVGIQWRPAFSRSAPVITARTPGTLRASVASMLVIVAWAYGLRTMSSQSMPGRTTSSMYWPAPRMNRGSSLRLTEWPMPPTSGVVWRWGADSVVISMLPGQLAAAAGTAASAARISPAACWIDLTMFT